MIFVVATAFSQNQKIPRDKMLLLAMAGKPSTQLNVVTVIKRPASIKPIIGPDYYVSHLGFFCKHEIKLEKFTRVPFRFRLGSIEDCDRMEGKQRRK